MTIAIGDIWAASGILIGLQGHMFTTRVTREATRTDDRRITHLPWSDVLNLTAVSVLVGGVFLVPTLVNVGSSFVRHAFSLAVLLYAGHAIALAGHYNLYNSSKEFVSNHPTLQEKIIVGFVLLAAIAYVLLSVF